MIKLKDIYRGLFEVRIIDPKTWNGTEPIRDNDVVRVYHGFSGNATEYPHIAAYFGLSGKDRVPRTFSYEAVNNPRGLFVTVNPKTAMKEFGGSGVVIEFHAKVSDLEAPVWNSESGAYFSQGDYTSGFKDDDEREAKRLKNREQFKRHENPAVAQSDRPELAFWILVGAEQQALFTGDLNPNMIRAFWVNERMMNDRRYGGKWERMSRKEFIKRYPPKKYTRSDFHGTRTDYSDKFINAKNKYFKPADDLTDEAMQQFADEMEMDVEEIIDAFKFDDYMMNSYMYPKQIEQFKDKYGE